MHIEYNSKDIHLIPTKGNFSDAVRKTADILKNIIVNSPAFVSTISSVFNETELRAVFTDDQKKLLDKGLVQIAHDKNGRILAQLRGTNGKIAGNIRLEEVGLSPDIVSVVHTLSMQIRLNEISSKLDIASKKLSDIQKGQHNDRIGEAYAYYKTLVSASRMPDEERRLTLINIISQCEKPIEKLSLEITDILKKITDERRKLSSITDKISQESIRDNMCMLRDSVEALRVTFITECAAYSLLGAPDSVSVCVSFFSDYFYRTFPSTTFIEKLDSISDKKEFKVHYWKNTILNIDSEIKAFSLQSTDKHIRMIAYTVDNYKKCESCGKSFFADDAHQLCDWCRIEKHETDRILHNTMSVLTTTAPFAVKATVDFVKHLKK